MKYLILFLFIVLRSYCQPQLQWIDTLKSYGNKTITYGLDLDNSGNIYLAGRYWNGGPMGAYLHKYSPTGNLIWADTSQNNNYSKTGGVAVFEDYVYTAERFDANVEIAGTIYSAGMYLTKRTLAGQVLWAINQGFADPCDIKVDHTGCIYVCSVINGDVVKKYNSSGTLLHTINASGWLAIDGSDNVFVLGTSLRKYSSNGNILWSCGGFGPNTKLSVDQLSNSYFTDAGGIPGSNLTKYNSNGQFTWTYSVPYWGGNGICYYNNSVYVVGTYGNGNAAVGLEINKYDLNGNILWTYQLPTSNTMWPSGLTSKNGQIYICANHPFSYWAYLLKFSEPYIPTSIKQNQIQNYLSISPNPSCCIFSLSYKNETSGSINIKVYDALGKVVFTKSIKNFTGEVNETIDLTGFAKGVYVLELTDGTSAGASTGSANSSVFKETRKLVVE